MLHDINVFLESLPSLLMLLGRRRLVAMTSVVKNTIFLIIQPAKSQKREMLLSSSDVILSGLSLRTVKQGLRLNLMSLTLKHIKSCQTLG